jgi:hypothetical protein
MTDYTIKYWRPKAVADLFEKAGIRKSEGMVTSKMQYMSREGAVQTVERVNAEGPEVPCELVVVR